MKGVILAGGLGKRLRPLTIVTNKHLLPVYDRPMIHYPVECFVNAGIRDVLLVTGGEHAGDFLKLLRNGKHLGLNHLAYAYQDGHRGIADALTLAEDFADGERICVALGDNLLEEGLHRFIAEFQDQSSGARLLLKKVCDPRRFGVATVNDGNIVSIVEKPRHLIDGFAVTGIYFYDNDVFEICKSLSPSERGELEITEVNNHYLSRGDLRFSLLSGWWSDAGTFESLLQASNLVAASRSKC